MVCPFCVLNFSVYAKLEELEEDSAYFMARSNLSTRLETSEKLNTKHDKSSEESFWSQVDKSLIHQLGQHWAYGVDFTMFGYSIQEYLDTLGLA